MTAHTTPRLPLYLAVVYTLLALYASLHPFAGWHATGGDPFDFLFAAWPRYVTRFDLFANSLAYVPLGFLWACVLRARLPRLAAFALAFAFGTAFSFVIETVQSFLPYRVPSNLDFACNALGALLGAAAGARWGAHLLDGGRWHAWREQRFLPGTVGDVGLVLLSLWFLAQLNPETFLFGNLRGLLGLPAPLPFDATRFAELETAAVAAQTLAIVLIGAVLAASRPVLLPLTLLGTALAIKSLALALLVDDLHGLAWATPGALLGLALGLLLWALCARLGAGVQQALAALALMFAAALANLMPDNPYLEHTLSLWRQGHFLNFNGTTRLISSLWPYLALPWLILSQSERR